MEVKGRVVYKFRVKGQAPSFAPPKLATGGVESTPNFYRELQLSRGIYICANVTRSAGE